MVIKPRDPLIDALALRRTQLGITLADVSRLRGLETAGRTYLSRCENGHVNPTLAVIRSWADALGCDVVLLPRSRPASIGDGGPNTAETIKRRRRVLLALDTEENDA